MKRLIPFLLFLLMLPLLSLGQRSSVQNLQDFDQKKFHFGFMLGMNSADFTMDQNLSKVDSLLILETIPQSGFNLGILADLHLGPYFNLRFIPQLGFTQRNMSYTFLKSDSSRSVVSKPIESTYMDFPINVKFRSARINNFAAYLVGGGRYHIDLASQQNVNLTFGPDIPVPIKRHSYSWEAGFGMDFFLPYFKFSPEIKMAYGLNNVAVPFDTRFSKPIDALKSKIFLISLYFEG